MDTVTLIVVLIVILTINAAGIFSMFAVMLWYVRSVIKRDGKREQAEHGRREKSLEALVSATATLAILTSRMQSYGDQLKHHEQRMQEEHQQLQDGHERMINECFSRRGIGE